MDSRATENEILELENKLLHPTAEPISLPLYFLRSITGDFSDEQELGRGGYGVVYKGRLLCGLIVAVKKFPDTVVDDDQFQKEATSLMRINHQNVVRILGYCAESRCEIMEVEEGKGRYVLAEIRARMLCFEYMCNKGLDEYLSCEYAGLEWNKRYKIIKGICMGLDFLHKHNIVHLDLKPQNILMDANMMPKIADFGLSRLLGEQTYIVTVNRAGSRGYMAPEYLDKGVISKKADIFSFGVIVIEILKGCKDDYPDYRRSTKTDFYNFTEKVLSNWRNRLEKASKYTELELPTLQVKQCIDIALQCVHPDKEKRPNTLKIIEILKVEEGSSVQSGEDLLVGHQDVQRGDDGVVASNRRSIMKDYAPPRTTGDTVKSAVAPSRSLHEPPLLACAEGSLAALHHQGAPSSLAGWAATLNLGPNVEALQRELLYAKASHLKPTLSREIDNPDINELLLRLQDLCYDAEDMLDELEYFCIQEMLDVSSDDAADWHADGCSHNTAHNVFPCSPLPAIPEGYDDGYYHYESYDDDYYHDEDYDYDDYDHDHEPPKLRFDRVDASRRMQQILEQMQTLRQHVSEIITLSGSNWSTAQHIDEQSRPVTVSESIEPKLYGRELVLNNIIHDITKGKHSGEVLTVIPIVGPGGIGKTTLAQHIYHSGEVQEHFDVRVWICVSLNFNVKKLTEEIQKYITNVDGESKNGTANELIGQKLKNKRLLLVLDDIWDCSDEDEWKRLLMPFQKSQVHGNIIMATTRFPAQAQIMVRKNEQSIYLQGIENKEFEELFLEIVFGDDDQSRRDHEFLRETGFKIVDKLKGSPLAAKTVGRLLKTQLDLVHWTRVLENKEWEQSNGKNDIMPALKLSFDYLPSHQLKQCFSYSALFPLDYKFKREELINFWIGLEVLYSSHHENKRVEDIGLSHLTELVNYGFFQKNVEKDGSTCYIIHDLLHELARKVSSHECLTIDSSQSQVRSLEVRSSIRHLSINIDDTSVKDRLTLKNCVEDFNTLAKRLKVQKIRSLMLFGEHHGLFVKAFHDLFKEAKALRVIFLSEASYNVEYLLHNFYNLLHLRYLRIENSVPDQGRFPNKISRFHHMMILDAKHCDTISNLPRDISNLIKLRHFLVRDYATHSRIIGAGKLKSLQELRRFVVKREAQGFELKEIGHLVDLHGSLCIANLENVQEKKEPDEAKLLEKNHLHELILHWDNFDRSPNDYTLEEHVLERLKPSSNLLKLSVKGHKGATCPSWLGTNLSVKSLESLCLDGVAWKTFPPIGELSLANEPHGEFVSGTIPKKRFGNLRRLEICELTTLKKWVVHAPCQLFPYLEALTISGCPQLVELSFEHLACCQQGNGANLNLFPRLSELKIDYCPQLLSFPPVPWTKAPCSTSIARTGSSCLDTLFCDKNYTSEYTLKIVKKKDTNDSTFWNVLAFQNLGALKNLSMSSCQPLPLRYLEMLSSLRNLEMSCWSNVFPIVEADRHVKYQFPVERLTIDKWNASGEELSQLLTYFPELSNLQLKNCHKVTVLGVKGPQAAGTRGARIPIASGNAIQMLLLKLTLLLPTRWKASLLQFLGVTYEEDARAEEAIVASEQEAEPGLLLLPPQLQKLRIVNCPELRLHLSKDGPSGGGGGGGLQGLTSLRWLHISTCPKLLFAYSSSSLSCCFPFPNSLEDLMLTGIELGTETLLPLSNLTSLTRLSIRYCGELRGEGLLSLLSQANLTRLDVVATPNFFVDSKPQEQELPPRPSKLQELHIDDVAGLTDVPISRRLLFSSLTALEISRDEYVESFEEEQEALLFPNSLEEIKFDYCRSLQCLPARLHKLTNLKRLEIWGCDEIQILPNDALPSSLQELVINDCPEIRSLPKVCFPSSLQKLEMARCQAIQMLPEDALPSSLQELEIDDCPAIQSLPKDCLPSSLQKLRIEKCPGIRSLPEVDDLPSSLRQLDVTFCESDELRRQCRRLINIIPIVEASRI